MPAPKVAALCVDKHGPYFGRADVIPYGIEEDALTYHGSLPVVTHSPCKSFGRFWPGGPSAKVRRRLGDDGGCFEHCLRTVRRVGGVGEHPEGSHAWRVFGIPIPPKAGGWVPTGDGGWTCCVYQGHYGHTMQKATWLVLYGYPGEPPPLRWGSPGKMRRADEGFHSKEARAAARAAGVKPIKRASKSELLHTPLEFAELLIGLAAKCGPPVGAAPVPSGVELAKIKADLEARLRERLDRQKARRRARATKPPLAEARSGPGAERSSG